MLHSLALSKFSELFYRFLLPTCKQRIVFLALSGFCVSCSQIEDPFAHIKQLHQAEGESIDRKEEDPPFSPPPPHRLDPPHYFWEK